MDLHYIFIPDLHRAREMSGDGYARGNITLGDGYASGDIIDSWTIPGGEETDLSDPGSDDLDSLDQRNVQEKNYSERENWRTPSRSVLERAKHGSCLGKNRARNRSPPPVEDRYPPTPKSKRSCTSDASDGVSKVLTNLTNSLNRLVDRFDKQESRLTSIENKLSASASSSSSPEFSKKREVPFAYSCKLVDDLIVLT